MLRKELLDVLCCPKCRGALSYKTDPETLTCLKCGAVYQVRNDIPIMVASDERK